MERELFDDAIGILAVRMNLLSQEEFEEAKEIAIEEDRPLEDILIERGYLKEKEVQELQLALGTTGVIRRKPR